MIEQLRDKAGKEEEMETQFLSSDQAYAKAVIPPTDKVQNTKIYYHCLNQQNGVGLLTL